MPARQLCAQGGSGESQGEEGGEQLNGTEERLEGEAEGGGTIFESQAKTLQAKL